MYTWPLAIVENYIKICHINICIKKSYKIFFFKPNKIIFLREYWGNYLIRNLETCSFSEFCNLLRVQFVFFDFWKTNLVRGTDIL
jgi:hypothetical protein